MTTAAAQASFCEVVRLRGTNAHAIIEECLLETQGSNESFGLTGLLIMSAHSGPALLNRVQSLHSYLENPSVNLSDLGWTLQAKRTTHRTRTTSAKALD